MLSKFISATSKKIVFQNKSAPTSNHVLVLDDLVANPAIPLQQSTP
jgi:hypothetical protein